MILNSRGLGLLLAVCIGVITAAFLSLLPSVTDTALFVAFGLSFSSSYLLMRLVLEFLFFKEINSIYEALEKIQNEDFSTISKQSANSLSPLKLINREIRSYVENKQQEIDELRKMETFRREFIADVSHELKTPIFAAQGFVHTLLDGAVEDKKVRNKFLKKAAKSLDGLDILVQDLLTISQMETGDIKMHYEHFDIVDLTRDVFDQVERKAEKKEIELKLESPSDSIYVYADYQRIYQVLSNLIMNGIKYTRKDGWVKVIFAVNGEDVTTTIEDNGRGIPKEHLGRIFERFYRVEKSRSKEKGGSGLGLSIVKHIMEGHKSKIEVSSEYRVGSRFWFKLKVGEKVDRRDWEDEED